MEIGISTASFYPMQTEDTIKIISDMESSLCEVFLEAEYEYGKEFIRELKERMESCGVRTNSVHAFCATFEHQLFSEYERRRRDAIVLYKKVLEAASVLGAKYYTFHGDNNSTSFKNINIDHYYKCLSEIAYIARSYDVYLAWENVVRSRTSRPDFIKKIRDITDDVKFTLDIKQARRAGVPLSEYIKAMGDDMVNVHVSDYDTNNTCLLPGKGEFDFCGFFRTLKENGYKNDVIIEVYSTDYSDYGEIKDAFEYLKGLAV